MSVNYTLALKLRKSRKMKFQLLFFKDVEAKFLFFKNPSFNDFTFSFQVRHYILLSCRRKGATSDQKFLGNMKKCDNFVIVSATNLFTSRYFSQILPPKLKCLFLKY